MLKNHKTLDRKIWLDDDHLRIDVAGHIMNLARTFLAFIDDHLNLECDKINEYIDDIIFLGSMTGYNYRKNSDIDIHIHLHMHKMPLFKNLDQIQITILSRLMNDKFKALFDPHLFGREVEFAVRPSSDVQANLAGSAWSIPRQKWISKPVRLSDDEFRDLCRRALTIVSEIEYKAKKIIYSKAPMSSAADYLAEITAKRKMYYWKAGGVDYAHVMAYSILRDRGMIKKLELYRNSMTKSLCNKM